MEKVQKTLDFLMENECPRKLRTEIIQWTRFSEEHHDANEQKKVMIESLPANLQKGLVRHLYSREVSRVPVFAYIESVDEHNEQHDAIQEAFLNNIFLLFQYKTYTPGEVIINFSDPADQLVIIVSGKVTVEFEHSTIHRNPLMLKDGDYVGDMAILGDEDWANSTCFHFPPADTDENTEIQIKTYPNEYVVVLQLNGEQFQEVLNNSAVVTQAAVSEYIEKWKQSREAIACETDPLKMFRMKQIRNWEGLTLRLKKAYNQHQAQEEHSEWNFAAKTKHLKAKTGGNIKTKMDSDGKSPARREEGGAGGAASVKALEGKVDTVLAAVAEMQSKVLSLSLAHSLSHVQTMERVEALAARVDLVYEKSAANGRHTNGGPKPSPKPLPKIPGVQSAMSASYVLEPGKKPSFLTQSLEVELTLV